MTVETTLLTAVAALQALSLWVLTDLRDRVRRLEDKAMQIDPKLREER